MAGWLSGNGALLNCCIARAEQGHDGYSMLDLCRDISDRAVPPEVWDELSAAMRAEPSLLVG